MVTDKDIVNKEEGNNQNTDNIISSPTSNENLVQILVEKENIEISNPDLGANDHKILLLLNDNSELNYYYTFRGIMRKTNLHQQSLSRSLQRLESLELIEKTMMGYKITKECKTQLSKRHGTNFPSTPIKIPIESTGFTQLIQTHVPYDLMTHDIIAALTGKWFDTLRWLGLVEGDNEYLLQWISTDHKILVNLRILSRYIIIETNATNEKDRMESMISSYKILDYATKLAKNKINRFSPTPYEIDILD